tara:strand:- start:4284 stop:4910 length:627 start_codon:yes stop_codon:yes gene_type:complete
MELINCPSPPKPFSLVMARIPNSNNIQFNAFTLSKHFPKRDINRLIKKRLEEHYAVIASVQKQIGHDNWHLEHEKGGRPILYVNGEKSSRKISISHMQCPEKASYAVSLIAEVDFNIGVDIVYTHDERIDRISDRTMNEEEVKSGSLAEVWALKEAVYKAFGPGVDLKNEIRVNIPIESSEVDVECRGVNGKWKVFEVSCVTLAMGPF